MARAIVKPKAPAEMKPLPSLLLRLGPYVLVRWTSDPTLYLLEVKKSLRQAGMPPGEISRKLAAYRSEIKEHGIWTSLDQGAARIFEFQAELESKTRNPDMPGGSVSSRLEAYREEMKKVRKDHLAWVSRLFFGPHHKRKGQLLSVEGRISEQCLRKKLANAESVINGVREICMHTSFKVHELRCARKAWEPAYEKIKTYQKRFSSGATRGLAPWDDSPPQDLEARLLEPVDFLKSIRETKSIYSAQAVRTIILNAGVELSEILIKACPTRKVADELAAALLDPWLRGVRGTTADGIKTARLSDLSPPRRSQRK